jgi:hypothetical protein
MGLDDFLETQVGVAVAATAALASPRAREVMRRGLVYGVAGALKAGDLAGSAARGVAAGVRSGGSEEPPGPSPPEKRKRPPARRRTAGTAA